jgi:uncharacterized membrane protein YfcA
MAHAMLSLPDTVLLLVAGVLAGIVGTAGAITSLVSYPALLLAGVPALAANIANIVAITTTWPASALASRAELAGRRRWLRRYAPVAALGGALGTALLLRTSADTFERVVPFLVAIGSLALLVAPRLTARRRASAAANTEPWWLAVGLLFISIYNGYFGAGAGVMTLALVLVASGDSLPVANALKNMLVGAATIAGALALLSFGHVRWDAVVPLGIGVFAGGTLGPRLARRIPERVLRPLVAAFGIGLAIQLWLSHGA